MLRMGMLVFSVVLAGTGLMLLMAGFGWQVLVLGTIILIAVLGENWRYRRIENPLNGRWQRTGERFVDPGSGQTVEVLYNPESGERRYAPSPGSAPRQDK
jgi:hypothetical protein